MSILSTTSSQPQTAPFDSAPTALMNWDLDGRCTQICLQGQSLFNVDTQSAIGKTWAELSQPIPEDQSLGQDCLNHAKAQLHQYTTNNNDSDNLANNPCAGWTWTSRHLTPALNCSKPPICSVEPNLIYHWQLTAFFSAPGQLTGWVTTVQNLSEANKLARRINAAEHALEMTQRLAAIGTWEFDFKHNQSRWSPQVFQLFGRDPSLGALDLDGTVNQYEPSSRAQLSDLIHNLHADPRTSSINLRLTQPSGRVATHYAVIEPMQETNGEIYGVRGTVQDITTRLLMEASLAESELRFRLLAEYSADIISLLNLKGEYAYASPAIEQVTGRKRHEVIHQNPLQWVHPEDKPKFEQAMQELEKTGNCTPAPYRLQHLNGQWIWIEGRYAAVRDTTGTPTYYVSISRDVSERIRLQSESRARELAHLSRLATIGEMSTSIAHEVNQPLAAIAMLARTFEPDLEQGQVDHVALLEVLRQIASESLRAGQIIHRVKSMARRRENTPETCELVELIQQALAILEPASRLHNCQIEFNPNDLSHDSNPILVHADPVEIKQVILNLMLNAMDAIKESDIEQGHIRVQLDAYEPKPNSNHNLSTEISQAAWLIRVSDNGPGIQPDQLKAIFNPFITTKESGLGLGLSICVNLIENHGGKIWAQAAEPRGACFCVLLPQITAANAT